MQRGGPGGGAKTLMQQPQGALADAVSGGFVVSQMPASGNLNVNTEEGIQILGLENDLFGSS
jgi:hypothetical protein